MGLSGEGGVTIPGATRGPSKMRSWALNWGLGDGLEVIELVSLTGLTPVLEEG